MRENPLAPRSGPRWESLQRSPDPLAGVEGLAAPPQQPHPRSRPPTLALRASLLASPNPFTKIRVVN